MYVGSALADLISMIFKLFYFIVLLRVIMSWVSADWRNPIVQWAYRVTEPFLAPIRRLIPAMGGIDFSPFILLLLMPFIQQLVISIILSIF